VAGQCAESCRGRARAGWDKRVGSVRRTQRAVGACSRLRCMGGAGSPRRGARHHHAGRLLGCGHAGALLWRPRARRNLAERGFRRRQGQHRAPELVEAPDGVPSRAP